MHFRLNTNDCLNLSQQAVQGSGPWVCKLAGFDNLKDDEQTVRRKMNKDDCSLLPPCRKVLAKKMQCVNYISIKPVVGECKQDKPHRNNQTQ